MVEGRFDASTSMDDYPSSSYLFGEAPFLVRTRGGKEEQVGRGVTFWKPLRL